MIMEIKKHLNMLGLPAVDKVTGFKGVISLISFDLYGCVQGIITPRVDKDGKYGDPRWFDIDRLKIVDFKPVMKRPDFIFGLAAKGDKGPEMKPIESGY